MTTVEYDAKKTDKIISYLDGTKVELIPSISIGDSKNNAKLYEISDPYFLSFVKGKKNGEKFSQVTGDPKKIALLERMAGFNGNPEIVEEF